MFTEDDVICTYTREQAIEDGLLVPVETAHFEGDVVITAGIAADFEGDTLEQLLAAMATRVAEERRSRPDEYLFEERITRLEPLAPAPKKLPAEGQIPCTAAPRVIWCEIDESGAVTIMYPEER